MMRVAAILKGKTVNPDVSLVIAPGSRQVLSMLSANGALHDMIEAGARICETACGFCIGMGQSPCTNAVSVRTNNRNFFGRSGTKSAGIYLVSCETAAATALTGVLTDPRGVDADLDVVMPDTFLYNDNLIIPPAPEEEADAVEVVRGPNIKPFPKAEALAESLSGKVLLKMEKSAPEFLLSVSGRPCVLNPASPPSPGSARTGRLRVLSLPALPSLSPAGCVRPFVCAIHALSRHA